MHCAALLAHPKILITPEEQPVRPHPKRLVCTGDRARDIMVKYGGHPADEVVSGYALRHEYLRGMDLRKTLNKPVKNILVVLEGLPSMSNLLRFVYDALNHENRYRTVIRSHPSFNLGTILEGAGLSLEDLVSLTPSKHTAISEDLAKADLVVYKGSTAAIEAGYLGIPLIHVATANLLTDDPLFEIASLKRVVKTAEDMVPAIEEYSAMEQSQFVIERDDLRRYSEQYLTIPGADAATLFAPASP